MSDIRDLLNKLKQLKDDGKEVIAITPLSSLLRAIWISEPDITINNLQKILSFLKIVPSYSDFKNEKEVTNEIIEIAGRFSGKKNEN